MLQRCKGNVDNQDGTGTSVSKVKIVCPNIYISGWEGGRIGEKDGQDGDVSQSLREGK